MAMPKIAYSSIEQRAAMGRKSREQTPMPSHAKWVPATDRADPVVLHEQDFQQFVKAVRTGRLEALEGV